MAWTSETAPRTGRKPGTKNKATLPLKEMAAESLERLGGVKYLMWLGQKEPAAYVSLLKSCIPRQDLADLPALQGVYLQLVCQFPQPEFVEVDWSEAPTPSEITEGVRRGGER
jgi:hypothetical protein